MNLEYIKKNFFTILTSILLITFIILFIVFSTKKTSCNCVKTENYKQYNLPYRQLPNTNMKPKHRIKENYEFESLCKSCPLKRNGVPLIFDGVGN